MQNHLPGFLYKFPSKKMSDSLKARINEAKPDATEGEMEARFFFVFDGGIGFLCFLLEASDHSDLFEMT